jgi:hypothetical protein
MKNTQEMLHLLTSKVPENIWTGLEYTSSTTGLSKTDQVRLALMRYLGINDLREPFKPANKQIVVTSN